MAQSKAAEPQDVLDLLGNVDIKDVNIKPQWLMIYAGVKIATQFFVNFLDPIFTAVRDRVVVYIKGNFLNTNHNEQTQAPQ